jgi:hypothetical protein
LSLSLSLLRGSGVFKVLKKGKRPNKNFSDSTAGRGLAGYPAGFLLVYRTSLRKDEAVAGEKTIRLILFAIPSDIIA